MKKKIIINIFGVFFQKRLHHKKRDDIVHGQGGSVPHSQFKAQGGLSPRAPAPAPMVFRIYFKNKFLFFLIYLLSPGTCPFRQHISKVVLVREPVEILYASKARTRASRLNIIINDAEAGPAP